MIGPRIEYGVPGIRDGIREHLGRYVEKASRFGRVARCGPFYELPDIASVISRKSWSI